ncbi:MAG: 4Fe-4S double cluster binding domain-containing protein [Actinomycetota bacterium]|nr:4Fe-4S double cluster binding domain-containing protein [Actinomycetota bacterium]
MEPFERERAALISSRSTGMAGPLRFTYGDPELATDLRISFPWARSVVVVGIGYLGENTAPASTGALIGRFALEDRYGLVGEVTSEIAGELQKAGAKAEVLIDDNRLVDRGAAARAGAGWVGKSTMILAPGQGPWLLLGSVVTDLLLDPTPPMKRGCGTCVACIPACPTGAITDKGLDARKCLSTWLQTPGSLPHWIRPHLGRRIYGCDDCLTSCPPGARALSVETATTQPLAFSKLLDMTDEELMDRFAWWYVPRRDGRFIRRNLLVAAGNSGEDDAVPPIIRHLGHRSSMIRGHASWALARSQGGKAKHALEDLLANERVAETRDEIEYALEMIR